MKTIFNQIALLVVIVALRDPNAARADIEISGYVFQAAPVVTLQDSGITNDVVPISGTWSVPDGSFNASAFYGSNQLNVVADFLPQDNNYSGDDTVQGSTYWSDYLVVTGGTGNVTVMVSVSLDYSYTAAASVSWGFLLNNSYATDNEQPSPYSNVFPWEAGCVFGQPFIIEGHIGGFSNGEDDRAAASMKVDAILLPDGASIRSTSPTNWVQNITILHPSLTISSDGTNVFLHWFALSYGNFEVQTTTDLLDPASWENIGTGTAGDNYQFTFAYPMDSVSRYFRLVPNF